MRLKGFLLSAGFGLVCGVGAYAEEAPPLGNSHFSMEFDHMSVQHRTFETDGAGPYVGLAGYGHLGQDWYLGGEIGAGTTLTLFGLDESSYMPLEINAKRGLALSPRWAVDLGAGLSFNRISYHHDSIFIADDEVDINEWVLGGQVLGGAVFKARRFFVGLKLKYQLTADVDEVATLISPEEGWDYSNLKIGVQIGFLRSR